MDDSELLNQLSCSNSNVEHHILKEPLGLDCGHCVCKSCIPNGAIVGIKCNKCGKYCVKDFRHAKPLILFEKMLEMSLDDLNAETDKQILENTEKLKSKNIKI